MEKSTVDKLQKALLLFVSVGLIPIALGYGLVPEKSMDYLFGVSVTEINLTHILRAVMGLYLALVIFWVIGAFRDQLRQAALYSLVVFMFGLAAGRILSLIVDGVPNWLLILYTILELGFGTIGLLLVRK
jgi:predicted membrane protein